MLEGKGLQLVVPRVVAQKRRRPPGPIQILFVPRHFIQKDQRAGGVSGDFRRNRLVFSVSAR